MQQTIKIDKLAKKFSLPNKTVYDILLAYGNMINSKTLHYTDTDTIVMPLSMYDDIIKKDKYVKSLVYGEANILKESSARTPFDTVPRVYFLLDDNVIVYIGQSICIAGRINQHIGSKTFNKVSTFKTTALELDVTENVNILYYKPIYNSAFPEADFYLKEAIRLIHPTLRDIS